MEQNKNYGAAGKGVWTEPVVRRLMGLWRERMSAARIAKELGPEFTRSAVVGKLIRLGLRRSDEQRRDAQAAGARSVRRRSRPPSFPPIPLPPPTPCPVIPRLIGILELRRSDCRWPYEAGRETRFCGHPAAPGSGAYCAAHRVIAYAGTLPPLTPEMLETPNREQKSR